MFPLACIPKAMALATSGPANPAAPTLGTPTGDGIPFEVPLTPGSINTILYKCNDNGSNAPDNQWANIWASPGGGGVDLDANGGTSGISLLPPNGFNSTKFWYRVAADYGAGELFSNAVSATSVSLPPQSSGFVSTVSDGNGIGGTTGNAEANSQTADPFVLYEDGVFVANLDENALHQYNPGAVVTSYDLTLACRNIYGTGPQSPAETVSSVDVPGEPAAPTLDDWTDPIAQITLPAAPAYAITTACEFEYRLDGGSWTSGGTENWGAPASFDATGWTTSVEVRVKAETNIYGTGPTGLILTVA